MRAVTAIYDSRADVEIATDSLLHSLRYLSPSEPRMYKELVTLGWKFCGKWEQQERVSELFGQMLRPGTEGAFGAAEFHARRKVDWDAYRTSDDITPKPKLREQLLPYQVTCVIVRREGELAAG